MTSREVLVITLLLLACGPQDASRDTPAIEPAPVAEASDEELEQLRALGYVEEVENDVSDMPVGAHVIDAERRQPGLDLYVNAHLCSAELMSATGTVFKSWSHEPCLKWGNAILTPEGELLAIHRDPSPETAEATLHARALLKFDWDGRLLWRAELPSHHDVDLLPDGRIAVLTYGHRLMPEIDAAIPVRDHGVALLDADGQIVEQASLMDILQRSPGRFTLQSVRPRVHEGKQELDLIHSNSIEWMRDPALAAQNDLYAPTNFLFCSRNQDSVAIVDWATKRVVWSWGQGEISGPHDATLLASGNVLIFDNGLSRRWSRVVEVDPRTNRIVWSYQAPERESLWTSHRGAAQRLANGNTLITDSAGGRAFEVTPDGTTVWSFVNPNLSRKGKRVVIVRTRRVERRGLDERSFEWSD